MSTALIALIDAEPATLIARDIVATLTARLGAVGDVRLGDAMADELHLGTEDHPEPETEDDVVSAMTQHCVVGVERGSRVVDFIQYSVRMREPESGNPRMDEVVEGVQSWLFERLGKPSRRSRKETVWEWEGGSVSLRIDTDADWDPPVRTTEIRWFGRAPLEGAASAVATPHGEPPTAESLILSLNRVAGDCFDPLVRAERAEVSGDAYPYEITVECTVDDGEGSPWPLKFSFTMEDASVDLVQTAIELIREELNAGR